MSDDTTDKPKRRSPLGGKGKVPSMWKSAHVMADAYAIGEQAAAKKWGVPYQLLQYWRKQLNKDAMLAEMVAAELQKMSNDLADLRVQFLREAIDEMRVKLPTASLKDIAEAVKVIGDQHQAAIEAQFVLSAAAPNKALVAADVRELPGDTTYLEAAKGDSGGTESGEEPDGIDP